VFSALLFYIFTFNAYATNCTSTHYDQTVNVAQVYDGDTLRLVDGRKLRLIGINTPERGRDGQPNQPFYTEAKNRLQSIVQNNNNQLKIVLGQDKHDRYTRLLAHIFTLDGKNISQDLIREGLGYNIAIPPNLQFLSCYKEAENAAKKHRRGIWNHRFSKPIKASALTKVNLGFQLVTGKVQRIGESRSSTWLNLDKKFALKIQKKYLDQFTTYQPGELLNKKLIARGWIYLQNNEYRMSIKHPASLQLQNSD
jgi:endonuclease YncB( thermonuclease family)